MYSYEEMNEKAVFVLLEVKRQREEAHALIMYLIINFCSMRGVCGTPFGVNQTESGAEA